METTDKIKKIIAEHLDLKRDLESHESLEDLGADSLDHIEIAMVLAEGLFLTEIKDEEAFGWKTVGDIIDSVNKKLNQQSTGE